jgi:hypothetical protein
VHRREVLVGQRGWLMPVGAHRSFGDLPDAKTREYEGLVAKSLSMGIVQTIVVSIADSAGAYFCNHHHACGHPTRGPHRSRAMPVVGRARLICLSFL